MIRPTRRLLAASAAAAATAAIAGPATAAEDPSPQPEIID